MHLRTPVSFPSGRTFRLYRFTIRINFRPCRFFTILPFLRPCRFYHFTNFTILSRLSVVPFLHSYQVSALSVITFTIFAPLSGLPFYHLPILPFWIACRLRRFRPYQLQALLVITYNILAILRPYRFYHFTIYQLCRFSALGGFTMTGRTRMNGRCLIALVSLAGLVVLVLIGRIVSLVSLCGLGSLVIVKMPVCRRIFFVYVTYYSTSQR